MQNWKEFSRKKKKVVFKSSDKVAYSIIRKEARAAIVKAKYNYKENIEYKCFNSDQRAVCCVAVWDGMKLMTGLQESDRAMIFLDGYTSNTCLELNTFYLRFNMDYDNVKYDSSQCSITVFNIDAPTVAIGLLKG